ncbi:hypothetical protein [Arthrobacter sp. Alg241-R88]|uniref:hypothetical protein n=1 Tax=Arthrobacter sp. Alg241-R88 TaxID=2305984 RepID=UPI0013D7B3FD|nr:hypothetical protein [Arthrobacter sp. Alg241-R88]
MSDLTIDLNAALATAIARVRAIQGEPPGRPTTTCRCGEQDTRGQDPAPVADLRDADVTVERSAAVRDCHACPHGIYVGQMCIAHTPIRPSTRRDYYHPECTRL